MITKYIKLKEYTCGKQFEVIYRSDQITFICFSYQTKQLSITIDKKLLTWNDHSGYAFECLMHFLENQDIDYNPLFLFDLDEHLHDSANFSKPINEDVK